MLESSSSPCMSQGEFEAFYQRSARQLHGYLCRLTRDPATADEILQEAYIRMINAPGLEEPQRKAYLYKTATNLLRDRWRRLKREKEWSELDGFREEFHQNFDLSLDVSAVFEKLPARERAVLWLAHVEGLSHREIANVIGCKEKSVRVMVFRARENAKNLLRKAGFGVSDE